MTMPKTPALDFTTPLDASTLKDKSILVTGGASGIGQACVEAYASYGAFVTIADLQEEAGTQIVKDLTSKGYKVNFVQCDVTDYDSQFKAFKSAIGFGGGRLDVLLPCAGIIAQRNLFDMAASSIPSLDAPPPAPGLSGIDVNLKGSYYSCFLALHYFRLPEPEDAPMFRKAIVLVASTAAYVGYPFSSTYSISKFGIRGLFHGIREKALAQSPRVRVNLVAPWYIKTAMTTSDKDPMIAAFLAGLGFASMEDVVDTILRMSADEKVLGRAAIVVPEGKWDLGDNIWEGYGGKVTQERIGERMSTVLPKLMEARRMKDEHEAKMEAEGAAK
ncbi:NAD(P)-binding protein [Amniculicola lignicola CBS 123094]|uniref:NAD(P)-binding protein n=1 Tax=Amniculicola lignicola CBS 123094 TaxID=1392246 RepID=A0A6A5W5C8_9PLEO|nr:NAD(P)-binding protein [Amniculicola lignicola CBS 123094]